MEGCHTVVNAILRLISLRAEHLADNLSGIGIDRYLTVVPCIYRLGITYTRLGGEIYLSVDYLSLDRCLVAVIVCIHHSREINLARESGECELIAYKSKRTQSGCHRR